MKHSCTVKVPDFSSCIISGTPVLSSDSIIYLGVIFDPHFDFSLHYANKISLIKRHVAAAIRIFRSYIDFESHLIIYKIMAISFSSAFIKVKYFLFYNTIKYHTIIFDSWFSCNNTLKYIHLNLKKQFVCAIKTNRVIALSEQDKKTKKSLAIFLFNFKLFSLPCMDSDIDHKTADNNQIRSLTLYHL